MGTTYETLLINGIPVMEIHDPVIGNWSICGDRFVSNITLNYRILDERLKAQGAPPA